MNLIVRVKRRRSQEPSDSLWVVDDSGPTKKRPNTTSELTQCLTGLSTSSASAQTEDGGHTPAPSAVGRVFLRRVQTVEISAGPIMDLQTLTASSESNSSTLRSGKRTRTDDEHGEGVESVEESGVDGKTTSSSNGPNHTAKVLITNSKKVLRNKDTSEKFIVVDMAQLACSSGSNGGGGSASMSGSNRLSGGGGGSGSGSIQASISATPSSPGKGMIPKGMNIKASYINTFQQHSFSCTLIPSLPPSLTH